MRGFFSYQNDGFPIKMRGRPLRIVNSEEFWFTKFSFIVKQIIIRFHKRSQLWKLSKCSGYEPPTPDEIQKSEPMGYHGYFPTKPRQWLASNYLAIQLSSDFRRESVQNPLGMRFPFQVTTTISSAVTYHQVRSQLNTNSKCKYLLMEQ